MKFLNVFKSFYSQLFIYSFIQCFYLLTTNDVALSSKVLYTASLYIFYVLLSQIHKNIFRVGLIYSLIVILFIYPIIEVYGEPSYSLWASVYYTDYAETMSYLNVISWRVYIVLTLFVLYTAYIFTRSYEKIALKHTKLVLFILLISLPAKKVLNYGISIVEIDKYFNVLPNKIIVNIIKTFYMIDIENKDIIEMSKKEPTWKVDNIEEVELKDNMVIVVGESVRKDFLHNYGFEIENTPFLDSIPHIKFENYISVAPKTILSLTRSFSVSNKNLSDYEVNNSLITLANMIGYETYWVSNQGFSGYHNSPVSVIANQSKNINFLRKGDGGIGKNHQDEEMLPMIDRIIKSKTKKPKLIIVHMMGSHSYVCDRTKNEYDEFIISKDVSCYNKSIKNLDLFLKNIHQILHRTNKDFNLVYFSDHGQVVKDGLVSHGGKSYKEQYEAPLFIIGGGKFMTIKALRKGSDFLHLFCELNNVKVSNIKKNYRFISEDKMDEGTEVLDASEKIIDYSKLPSNAIKDLLKN